MKCTFKFSGDEPFGGIYNFSYMYMKNKKDIIENKYILSKKNYYN